MNWIGENKFLAGFIGFMVVAAGALGFLLFQQISDYSTKQADYNTKYAQLDQLQKRVPYPNEKNLDTYNNQHQELKKVIDELNLNLAKFDLPLDPGIIPQTFQKNLQSAIADATGKADAAKIQLPEKFAFGFDNYVSTLSIPAAAPALDRQLKAVQFVINELLSGGGVTSINSVTREALPEEKQGIKAASAPVIKEPMAITFVANWLTLRKVLNDLIQTKQQFYIVRLIDITTDGGKDAPISKADTAKAGTEKTDGRFFPLGNEKLVVTLSLEIVNFNTPGK